MTVQEMRDLFSKEQLLENMPSRLSTWVRNKKPDSTQHASHLADGYL